MAELLRCVDRWYREIVLFEDTWYDKLMAQRPILAPYLGQIERVLRDPDAVTFDIDHPDGENFYRAVEIPTSSRRSYLKVCVRFRPTHDRHDIGVIVTVFPTFRIKQGERLRWRR